MRIPAPEASEPPRASAQARMSGWLAAAALAALWATPARAAETPSARDQETIKAVFLASSADRFCPSLRQSVPRIAAFLKERQMSPEDIAARYGTWSQGFATVLSKRFVDAPQQTCADIDGMLGRDGEFPGLVERR